MKRELMAMVSSGLLVVLLVAVALVHSRTPQVAAAAAGAEAAAAAKPCGSVICGRWWKHYLFSETGNAWFYPWNKAVQAKLDTLAAISEARKDTETDPFRVLMVGDSTMSHQFGAICGFMGEREGRRYDPNVKQHWSPGCCMDTLPKEDGGGRGLCFQYDKFRFLDPQRPGNRDPTADAYYFGSGLHLLHMLPSWPESDPMGPLRTQQWLNYESLLEGVVRAVREKNGPAVKVIFMTSHAVADELYTEDYAMVRDAYRVGKGNSTVRGECERQVRAASVGDPRDPEYDDWHGVPDLSEFMASAEGEEPFTVDSYCEEALMDRRGSLQISRRARSVMSKLGVPIVDAASIVEGEAWASKLTDGRHYHPIVPLEVAALLELLTAPPPPPGLSEAIPGNGTTPSGTDEEDSASAAAAPAAAAAVADAGKPDVSVGEADDRGP